MRLGPSGYEKITRLVSSEVERTGAKHAVWAIYDLHDGSFMAHVWLGSSVRMTRLRRQLDKLPEINLAVLTTHATCDEIIAAVRRGIGGDDAPSSRRRKSVKRRRR